MTRFAPGDRVVGECVIGQEHFGFSISGAAAELFVAKEGWLHALPDDLTWTQGALVEPFSCGYYATVRADNLDASDTAVVLGAGPIGLGVVAAAAARGVPGSSSPSPIRGRAALAPDARGRATARPDGPATWASGSKRSPAGRRADVVFEASGKPAAMAAALDLAGFRARLVYIGIDVGGSRARRARPDPVQGAAGARHHRLARRVAADPAVPGAQRRRPQPARHLVATPLAEAGEGDRRPC